MRLLVQQLMKTYVKLHIFIKCKPKVNLQIKILSWTCPSTNFTGWFLYSFHLLRQKQQRKILLLHSITRFILLGNHLNLILFWQNKMRNIWNQLITTHSIYFYYFGIKTLNILHLVTTIFLRQYYLVCLTLNPNSTYSTRI